MLDDAQPRRRTEDREPAIMLAVEKRLHEDRHILRNEFAAGIARLEAAQANAQAQATLEHAQVRADVAELKHCVEPIPRLIEKVDAMEDAGAYEEGRTEGLADVRKTVWKVFGALVAFIGAMTGVLALLMNH